MAVSRTGIFASTIAFLTSSVLALAAETPAAPGKNSEYLGAAGLLTLIMQQGTCDALAAPPGDPESKSKGVEKWKIDVARALPVCETAAKQTPISPRNQHLYGRVLDAAKRYPEAAAQYQAADRAGYARATAALGTLYLLGQGVPKDEARAVGFLQRAGDRGYVDAYAMLGAIALQKRPPDYRDALVWYARATRLGSPLGQVGLGELYGGGFGVPKNQTQAVALFQQAADKGEPLGMYDLGVSYLVGAGVARNSETAFRWLLRAAELEIPQAQNVVAHMYEKGEGVGANRQQAMAWYRKAADQGVPGAQANHTRLESLELGVGDLIGDGGFITPLQKSAPPPSSAPSNQTSDPPYRPLPTQRASSDLTRDDRILLGALGIAALWWLTSGSGSSSSGSDNDPYPYVHEPSDPTMGRGLFGQSCSMSEPGCH